METMIDIGRVYEIVWYPIKSMAGITVDSAPLGWYGIEGDRRFAFRRIGDESGFPFLSASRLPELVLYHPVDIDASSGEPFPTRVRTPAGSLVSPGSQELQSELSNRSGGSVELMKLRHGIFDESAVSVIGLATIAGIGREAGLVLDRRRFRANIVLETKSPQPFLEDGWVGGTLVFGEGESPPVVSVTMRDERCVMVNIDPDTGEKDARVMKAVVRLTNNFAGVYASVARRGTVHVGDRVFLNTGGHDRV